MDNYELPLPPKKISSYRPSCTQCSRKIISLRKFWNNLSIFRYFHGMLIRQAERLGQCNVCGRNYISRTCKHVSIASIEVARITCNIYETRRFYETQKRPSQCSQNRQTLTTVYWIQFQAFLGNCPPFTRMYRQTEIHFEKNTTFFSFLCLFCGVSETRHVSLETCSENSCKQLL